MKIKKIKLLRYKRFYDLTIDLGDDPKKIIALVGPNGCGKSSVFDGMLFLQTSYQRIGSSNTKTYTYHSLEQFQNYNQNNIHIDFDKGDFITVANRLYNEGKKNTLFSFRSSFRYNGQLHVTESRALSDLKENNIGASTASDIDQRIDQNYRRLQIKYRHYMECEDCRPSEAKKHIIGELNTAIENCLQLKIDNLGDIENNTGTIFFSKPDTHRAFEYDVLSAGEKEVVDILLDLYLRKDEYTDSVFIIDEPELHLNTSIQRKLLIEINKMIPVNCQLWVATHSIGFLRALQEELNDWSQIIEFNEKNSWSECTYELKPMQKNCKQWKDLFSTALDDLANLVAPKNIVYCEGRDFPGKNGQENGLDANVYNIIFGKKHPDTQFVSSGGNTELDQRSDIAISILHKVFSSMNILVLKDRDCGSGKEMTEKDRLDYLQNNSENHRILNRFEIENYLFDKEVLQKYCQINDLNFDEQTYDSKVTDIINQHVKDLCGFIKNCCSIKSSINPEVFKKRLAEVIEPTFMVYQELENVIFHRK